MILTRPVLLYCAAMIAGFGCDRSASNNHAADAAGREPTTAVSHDTGKYEAHGWLTIDPATTRNIQMEDQETLKKEVLNQAIRELSTRPSSTTTVSHDTGKYEVHAVVTVGPATTENIQMEDQEKLKKEIWEQLVQNASTRPLSSVPADSTDEDKEDARPLDGLDGDATEPAHAANPATSHVEVVPKDPATVLSSSTYPASAGQEILILLPGPATTKELQGCVGQQLWTSLDTINLREVSGTLRLPTKDGEAELQIKEGTIVKVRKVPSSEHKPK